MDDDAITELTREYYDRVGARYYDLFRDELDGKPYDCEMLDRFASLLRPRALVCDAGCGPCLHAARYLRARGCRVCGMDLSQNCLKIAAREHPQIPLAAMNLVKLGFADGALEGLVAYYAIIYTPKRSLPALLREFRRVLKGSGRVLMAVKEGDGEGFIPDPLGTEMRPYFTYFAAGELTAYLSDAGFAKITEHVREAYPSEIANRRIFAEALNPR